MLLILEYPVGARLWFMRALMFLLIMGLLLANHDSVRLYLCHPFGWVNGHYLEGWVHGNPEGFWALLPIGGLLARVPMSLKTLRQLNAEGVLRSAPGKSGLEKQGSAWQPTGDQKRPRLVERLLTRFLSPREQNILEALLINRPVGHRSFMLCFFTRLRSWQRMALSPFGRSSIWCKPRW